MCLAEVVAELVEALSKHTKAGGCHTAGQAVATKRRLEPVEVHSKRVSLWCPYPSRLPYGHLRKTG